MSQGCQRDALHHSKYNFLIYCRHVLELPMVFVRSQHRPEITMYSSFIFLCYMLRIVCCKVHPKNKASTENCELF